MDIGVFGVGGVGGYFGGKLAAAAGRTGDRVFFTARGAHLAAILDRGLTLKTKDEGVIRCRPAAASADPADFPPLDMCLLCVKQYALEDAVRALLPVITEKTVLIPLLNGVDAYDKIRSVTDRGVVFPACVYIVTHREEPGVVEQSGGGCNIIFGPDPNRPEAGGEEVVRAFADAGIQCSWSGDAQREIWSKFMFVGPMSLVMALMDLTYGQVYDNAAAGETVRAIIDEVWKVCRASGVDMPESEKEIAFNKARGFPYGGRTSFQLDYADPDKMDERDTFGGAVTQLGRKYGVPTPCTDAVCRQLDNKIGRKER